MSKKNWTQVENMNDCSPEDPSSTDLRLVPRWRTSDTVEVLDPVDGSRQEDSVSGSLVRSGRDYLNGGLA